MRHSRPGWAAALLVALCIAVAGPSLAANWQPVGESGNSMDKVFVDVDSVKAIESYRLISVMTVYPAPRTNSSGLLFDRHVQINAVDCAQSRFVGVRTIGYLKDKVAGTSPEKTDWRSKLVPVPTDGLSQWVLHLACSTPLAGDSGAAPQSQAKVSTGSGIFVDRDGYVLTAAHVVNGCKSLAVKVPRAPPEAATLEAADPKNDLALIKTSAGYGVPTAFRAQSHPPRLGEDVAVVGYPLTGILSNEPKATFGQINSVAGINNDYTVLQFSAPVQPGNSGGPVFDGGGLVVGIVVSELSPLVAARIGVAPQNVNFAIRGELAQIFMTAHGIRFSAEGPRMRLEDGDIAAAGERSTALIVCLKQ